MVTLFVTLLVAQVPHEAPSRLARAELATGQTINGLVLGLEICGLASCDDVRAVTLLGLAGAGLGLSTSLGLDDLHVTPALALGANSGALWGAWHAIALNLEAENATSETFFASLIVGQLGGAIGGGLLGAHVARSAGDVSLANSGGLWGGAWYLLASEAFAFDARATGVLAASDVGAVAAALVASAVPMSRSRAILLDVGGVVGSLGGMAAYTMAVGAEGSGQGYATTALVGSVLGIAGSAYLTRNWDAAELEAHLSFAPTEGGGLVQLGATF